MTDDCRQLFAACEADPHNVTLQKILADALQEAGFPDTSVYVRNNGCFLGDGDGDGDGAYGAYGDGAYGDGDDGDGDGDGAYGAKIKLNEACMMTDGFYLLAIKAGYSPYVMAGWVERHDFLIRFRNCRVVRRFGQNVQLTNLAKDGPRTGTNPTQLLDLSDEEWVPLASIARIREGNPDNWPMCPKPKD